MFETLLFNEGSVLLFKTGDYSGNFNRELIDFVLSMRHDFTPITDMYQIQTYSEYDKNFKKFENMEIISNDPESFCPSIITNFPSKYGDVTNIAVLFKNTDEFNINLELFNYINERFKHYCTLHNIEYKGLELFNINCNNSLKYST